MHSASLSAVQDMRLSLEPQSVHVLHASLLAKFEYVPVLQGTHSPFNLTAKVVPQGGVGSIPEGHRGHEMHLTLSLSSSEYVSGGHLFNLSG